MFGAGGFAFDCPRALNHRTSVSDSEQAPSDVRRRDACSWTPHSYARRVEVGSGWKARRALPSERPREPFAGRVPAAAHEAGSIEEGGRRKRGRMRARFAACAFFFPSRACPHLLPDVLAGAWGFLFVPKKYSGHGAPVPPPLSGTRYHKLTRSRASRDTCLVPEKSLGHGPKNSMRVLAGMLSSRFVQTPRPAAFIVRTSQFKERACSIDNTTCS